VAGTKEKRAKKATTLEQRPLFQKAAPICHPVEPVVRWF